MKRTTMLLCLVAMTVPGAGCVPEDLGGGLDIVNETGRTLYLYDFPVPFDGGRWRYETSDCSDFDLRVRTKNGTVFAELTEEWCPGQTWTITGKGDSTLEDR